MKNNNKISLFILSIICSSCFIFLAIPNFIESKKIENLLIRINSYNKEDNFEGDGTINNNSNANQEPSNSNSDNNSSNNSNKNDNNQNSNDNDNNTNQNNGNSNSTESPINSHPKKITYTVKLEKNGALSIGTSEVKCETSSSFCQVTLPIISSDKDILGWSVDPSSNKAEYQTSQTININSNKILYAITKRTVFATIYGNGAYEGSKIVSCTYYNSNNSCNIILPIIPKDYYSVTGYTRNNTTDYIEYSENQTISLNQNIDLYTIRKIDSSNYDTYSSMSKEVFKKINDLRKSKGLSTLNYSKSLELTAMLRISEISRNYNFNINGDYHYRISNNEPFYTANEMAYGENFWRTTICDENTFHDTFVNSIEHLNNMLNPNHTLVGISIGKIKEYYYIVELFGTNA